MSPLISRKFITRDTSKAKSLAEEVNIVISTWQTGRTRRHRQGQITHVCQESCIDALILNHSACSSIFPSHSLLPNITSPYLQSSLSLLYPYFTCISILNQVELVLLFIYSWTKTFINALKKYW